MRTETHADQYLNVRPRTAKQIQLRQAVVEDFNWRLTQGWPRKRATLDVAKERTVFSSIAAEFIQHRLAEGYKNES